MMIRTSSAMALLLGLVSATVSAQSVQDAAVRDDAEQLRAEAHEMRLRLARSGAVQGAQPVAVELPAERVVDLGVLMDPEGARGPTVLAVTPGGVGAALGLRAGDVVARVGDREIPRGAEGLAQLRRAVDAAAGGTLSLDVVGRDGPRRLHGKVAALELPPMRVLLGQGALVASTGGAAAVGAALPAVTGAGCGRISVFPIAPRSRRLYSAKVLLIDGEIPGPASQDTYRVAPGRHVLTVAEQIRSEDLPQVYTRARRHTEQELVVDVQPGVTYMIAAELDPDRQHEIARKGYWRPVVWKEIEEPCR